MGIALGTCTRYRGRHVHSAHPDPADRRRTALLLASPRPLRAHRQRRPPAHPAQSRTPLRHSPGPMAAALLPTRRHPGRPDAPGRRLPDRRRTRSATHSRTVGRPRHARAGTGRRADRHPAGRRRLAAPGPPPQRRRRAGRPVGPEAVGPAGPADRVGRQRRVAHRGGRRRRRASGPAGPPSARPTAGCKRAAASASCSASTSRPSARCSSTAPRTRW